MNDNDPTVAIPVPDRTDVMPLPTRPPAPAPAPLATRWHPSWLTPRRAFVGTGAIVAAVGAAGVATAAIRQPPSQQVTLVPATLATTTTDRTLPTVLAPSGLPDSRATTTTTRRARPARRRATTTGPGTTGTVAAARTTQD